jgi:hypothetical protein
VCHPKGHPNSVTKISTYPALRGKIPGAASGRWTRAAQLTSSQTRVSDALHLLALETLLMFAALNVDAVVRSSLTHGCLFP